MVKFAQVSIQSDSSSSASPSSSSSSSNLSVTLPSITSSLTSPSSRGGLTLDEKRRFLAALDGAGGLEFVDKVISSDLAFYGDPNTEPGSKRKRQFQNLCYQWKIKERAGEFASVWLSLQASGQPIQNVRSNQKLARRSEPKSPPALHPRAAFIRTPKMDGAPSGQKGQKGM